MVDDLSLVGPRAVCVGRWTSLGFQNPVRELYCKTRWVEAFLICACLKRLPGKGYKLFCESSVPVRLNWYIVIATVHSLHLYRRTSGCRNHSNRLRLPANRLAVGGARLCNDKQCRQERVPGI
jgi:hypothetical protein